MKQSKRLELLLLIFFFTLAIQIFSQCSSADQSEGEQHRLALIAHTPSIIQSGVPGPLCVFGKNAFPVVVGRLGDNQGALIVGIIADKGRIIAYGHDYLMPELMQKDASTARFFENAVRWTAKLPQQVQVGVYKNNRLAKYLATQSWCQTVQEIDRFTDQTDLTKMNCLCVDTRSLTADDILPIQNYVRNGGGLITTGLGWGWLQLNPNKTLQDHFLGNKLLGPFGAVWADGYLGSQEGAYSTSTKPNQYLRADVAIVALEDMIKEKASSPPLSKTDISQISHTLQMMLAELPTNGTYQAPVLPHQSKVPILPTVKDPVKFTDVLKRLMVTEQCIGYRRAIVELSRCENLLAAKEVITTQLVAHPSGSDFPGAVPSDATRVTRSIRIDTSIPDWHSTGLYAAPGEIISIILPEKGIPKVLGNGTSFSPLSIRIGNHTDKLWHLNDWHRFPEISFSRSLNETNSVFANPFGGLIYIVVPRNCRLGEIQVTLSGAVEAPYYELEKTTQEDWKKIRNYPAPWAELATKNMVISVPSEVVRHLDDPTDVLKNFWDKTLDVIAEFASWEPKRLRPERISPDRQISAGYMHSGYPIMTHLDVQQHYIDGKYMTRNNWGFFHELGHNHQSKDWTFEGTTEVTVNFFSLYCTEKILGISIDKARAETTPEKRKVAFERYVVNGKKYESWKSDPFLALGMFIELQEEFGWEPFKKMIAEFRSLPENERPKNDLEKRQQFVRRFSTAAGKDITPTFQKWGVPLE